MATMLTTPTLSALDKDALERAIAIVLRHREPIYRREFKRRLNERQEPWFKIAVHAANVCQCEGVPPWRVAPHQVEPDDRDAPGFEHRGVTAAARLLARLLAAGKSRYEPDAEVLKRIASEGSEVVESARRDERGGVSARLPPPSHRERRHELGKRATMLRPPTASSTKTRSTSDSSTPTPQHPPPLALTDEQLDQVMRHAGVLHPGLRRAFVERVAYELRGQVIGDGSVARACAKVLKESGMFDPPTLSEEPPPARRSHGKYE
jgi:hypothetical protein